MTYRTTTALFILSCSWALGFAAAQRVSTKTARSYDVVVAGAGTGGTAAALEAARHGARVALLEETDWIGGQASAAGVSTMDEADNMTPPSGIYREFLDRMRVYYDARQKSISTCYWHDTTHCYEPSAIRKVLTEMIDDVNHSSRAGGHIDLMLRERVERVLATGDTVTGVVTQDGTILHSKILIDATEYGDVLPLTPARYRSGRRIGAAGPGTCTQDLTYVMIIKKYPQGVPQDLKMLHPPPGYDKWLPQLRAEWRIDGNSNTRTLPVNFAEHNAYRGLPDSSNPESYVSTEQELITRTALNWFNDYPAQTNIYNRSERKKILCDAKLKTLANLYYLQHELKESQWSVANDEGYDTPYNREENACSNIPEEFKAIENNMPPAPYIRESQRLVGEYTLTAADIRREKQGGISVKGFPDSIAVGDYADDLHGCNAAEDFDHTIESISNRPPGFRMGPFEVPLRALIPEKVDGLLAAEKNISQSRLANGATRLQPITMLTGEAAGALAALAVKQDVQPRAVSAEAVQRLLVADGSILAREPMADVPPMNRLWQAAQFALARQWLASDESGFHPNQVMTRAEVADLLVRAFQLKHLPDLSDERGLKNDEPKNRVTSYSDVPPSSPLYLAVEAWHSTGTVPSCHTFVFTKHFCPNQSLHTGDFLHAVATIYAQQHAGKKLEVGRLRQGVRGEDSDPLTRMKAVLILYNSGQ